MKTPLVVFDLDGTLVNSLEDIGAAANRALGRLGLQRRSDAEIVTFVGEGARRLMERAVGARADLAQAALDAFMEEYGRGLVVKTRPYEGIAEVLASLPVQLAVATNKPGRLARRILQELGLLERFLAVLGGDEAPRKPDPAPIERLAALVGARASDVVLVGDSRVDVATARAAGSRLIAVTWGFGTRDELVAAGARDDEMVGTVEMMGRALQRM
jgi:phosphoglycolate phosphatase